MTRDQYYIISAMITLVAMIPIWLFTHSLIFMFASGGLSALSYGLALNERGELSGSCYND